MAMIRAEIDTDACTASFTKDGLPIDHHNLSVNSYYMDNYQNGYGTFYYKQSGESYIGFWKKDKIYHLNF